MVDLVESNHNPNNSRRLPSHANNSNFAALRLFGAVIVGYMIGNYVGATLAGVGVGLSHATQLALTATQGAARMAEPTLAAAAAHAKGAGGLDAPVAGRTAGGQGAGTGSIGNSATPKVGLNATPKLGLDLAHKPGPGLLGGPGV